MGWLSWAVLVGILFVLPLWRIHGRVGLNPKLSLLALIPAVGLPLSLGILAFRDWPAGEGPVRDPFDAFDRAKERL